MSCCTLKNIDSSHIRYSNETLFSEKHILFMTELGYEAKSHKLLQGKSLVLKSCEFVRSSWLMRHFMVVLWHIFVRHKCNLD